MNRLTADDWATLEAIEHGRCAVDAATAARLAPCALIEEKVPGEGRYALTPAGWHALRQHRRLDPD
ncbi:hypothetical protein [Nevskia sp.]|uniref:hypothetical protein n=1 Tax=Nevskia sp. TaxID=1929292 RepID=UPI003F723C0A